VTTTRAIVFLSFHVPVWRLKLAIAANGAEPPSVGQHPPNAVIVAMVLEMSDGRPALYNEADMTRVTDDDDHITSVDVSFLVWSRRRLRKR
jgi:hypothetical protein